MVEQAGYMIAVYDNAHNMRSGTQQTVNYAKKKGASMKRYVIRRLLMAIPLLLAICLCLFCIHQYDPLKSGGGRPPNSADAHYHRGGDCGDGGGAGPEQTVSGAVF